MAKYSTSKKEMFATVIAIVEGSDAPNKAELIERLNHEVELISKKSSSAKATANDQFNASVTDTVIEVLTKAKKALTVSEIQAADTRLSLAEGVTNSRITANLTKLFKAGTVAKVVEKKKSYYYIPTDENEGAE